MRALFALAGGELLRRGLSGYSYLYDALGVVRHEAGEVEGRHTLVYDGKCRVCGHIVSVLREWDGDGRVEFVPFQDSEVPNRFPWISPAAFESSVQLIEPGGATREGVAAAEAVLSLLTRGRMFAWAFSAPYSVPVAEGLYRAFSRNRHRLGCSEEAPSLEPERP